MSTAIVKTKDGKWLVRDVRLGVEKVFNTFREAHDEIHKCNLAKLRQLQGLDPEPDND
jgi:hypothetical protein